MRGSIQQKSKIYYAVIALNGKRKWFRGGTKKAAQKLLTEKLNEIDNNTYREIPNITFEKFTEHWLKTYAEPQVKPSTYAGYKNIIEKHLTPVLKDLKLSEITTGQLQVFVADRQKDVSAKTVCNEIVVIKEMFKHAHRWGYLKINPAEHLERPKLTKPDIEILTPDEVEKLLDKAHTHYRIAFLTCVLTGLRAGELWGLQWKDINWNSKQIHIRRSLWKGNFQTPKSKYSIRRVDIPDSLVQDLKRWKLACPVNEYDLVFPSPEGKMSQHDNVIKRYFNKALTDAKLNHVSFHSLRHTNASMRIAVGQHNKYIQTQLGHASIMITMDIYGHLFKDGDFNKQQVELLEPTAQSVRKPLEKPVRKEVVVSVNPSSIKPLQVVANV